MSLRGVGRKAKSYAITASFIALGLSLIGSVSPQSVSAQSPASKERGLTIGPIRQFTSLDAGTTKQSSVTVGNYSDHAVKLVMSVKQFSVADYSYSFSFSDTTNNWLNFATTEYNLKPNETKSVPYSVTIPPGSAPGGQYYTLFATANGDDVAVPQLVQATSLLYLTVNGNLTYGSGLPASSIHHLVIRGDVPFTLDISNTGNNHFFTYINAHLEGPFTGRSQTSETHLLLPQTTRHFSSSLPTPILPGLYRAVYGYSTEQQPIEVTRVSRIIYVPPWSIATIVVIIWITLILVRRRAITTKHEMS